MLAGYDCVLIATDHTTVDYDLVVDRSKLLVDTRNVLKGHHEPKVIKL